MQKVMVCGFKKSKHSFSGILFTLSGLLGGSESVNSGWLLFGYLADIVGNHFLAII